MQDSLRTRIKVHSHRHLHDSNHISSRVSVYKLADEFRNHTNWICRTFHLYYTVISGIHRPVYQPEVWMRYGSNRGDVFVMYLVVAPPQSRQWTAERVDDIKTQSVSIAV